MVEITCVSVLSFEEGKGAEVRLMVLERTAVWKQTGTTNTFPILGERNLAMGERNVAMIAETASDITRMCCPPLTKFSRRRLVTSWVLVRYGTVGYRGC